MLDRAKLTGRSGHYKKGGRVLQPLAKDKSDVSKYTTKQTKRFNK